MTDNAYTDTAAGRDARDERTFRPAQWDDLDNLAALFEATWPVDEPVESAEAATLLGRWMTLHYMALTSEGTVCEAPDGTLLGVTLVRRPGEQPLFPAAPAMMNDIAARIESYGPLAAAQLAVFRRMFVIEGILEADSAIDLDTEAELELFAVASAARGTGVGGELWRRLLASLKERNVEAYFLHTDSTCDFGFYEHKGLDRVAERLHADHPEDGVDGMPLTMDQYIYRGRLDVPRPQCSVAKIGGALR